MEFFDSMLTAWICTLFLSMLIVFTQGWHGRLSLDSTLIGAQKFHDTPVPRIGGLALAIGIGMAFTIDFLGDRSNEQRLSGGALLLLVAGMPAFLSGLLEDLTKSVSVRRRLFATFASALLAWLLLDAYLPRLDIWGVDTLLHTMPLLAVVITAFAVAGVANSINIIDGFHGVAGGAVVIMLSALAFIAWRVGDTFVARLAILGIGATVGFLMVNYPTGKLFMGDGGAYLLGFWLAEVAVLLVARNPSVSAWQMLAICAYPVIEVLYSVYRKAVIRKMSPGVPDRLHMHMLIYRRVVCQILPKRRERPWIRNCAVAWVTSIWIAFTTLLALSLGNSTSGALAVFAAEALIYIVIYARLVRGRWCFGPVVVLGVREYANLRKSP
ncbi:glycosyltransferase [Herbaspirillum sp. GCM10030257]|uniref:MraY family glycosyltransferase n=1 Tax=Herbaspirillum sp. GCM10030257 TaxID=3273393 RepID=UPI003612E372